MKKGLYRQPKVTVFIILNQQQMFEFFGDFLLASAELLQR